MLRPSRRTVTRPTSFKTRRCLETEGCSRERASTIWLTVRSSKARKDRMSRRRGSATALKASEVVEARGMRQIYTHIGICQEKLFGGPRAPGNGPEEAVRGNLGGRGSDRIHLV